VLLLSLLLLLLLLNGLVLTVSSAPWGTGSRLNSDTMLTSIFWLMAASASPKPPSMARRNSEGDGHGRGHKHHGEGDEEGRGKSFFNKMTSFFKDEEEEEDTEIRPTVTLCQTETTFPKELHRIINLFYKQHVLVGMDIYFL